MIRAFHNNSRWDSHLSEKQLIPEPCRHLVYCVSLLLFAFAFLACSSSENKEAKVIASGTADGKSDLVVESQGQIRVSLPPDAAPAGTKVTIKEGSSVPKPQPQGVRPIGQAFEIN